MKTIKIGLLQNKYQQVIQIGFFALVLLLTTESFFTEIGCFLSGAPQTPLLFRAIIWAQKGIILISLLVCFLACPKRNIVFSAILSLIVFSNILLFPETAEPIRNAATALGLRLFAPMVICMSIRDMKRTWHNLKLCAYIASALSIIWTIFFVLGYNFSGAAYDMSYSYALLVPSLVLLASFFKEGKLLNLCLSGLLVLAILRYGARGPLLCYMFGVVILLIAYFCIKLRDKNVWVALAAKNNFCYALCAVFIAALLLAGSISYMRQNNISTGIRTIDAVIYSSNDFDSGRTQYHYAPAMEHIMSDSIFAGDGLFSDRLYLYDFIYQHKPSKIHVYGDSSGCYSHNILIEFMFQFGLIFGIIAFIALVALICRGYKKCNGDSCYLLCVFLAMSCALAISSSYLIYAQFWILCGLCVNIIINNSNTKIRRQINE